MLVVGLVLARMLWMGVFWVLVVGIDVVEVI
jgi:hypothetical protein